MVINMVDHVFAKGLKRGMALLLTLCLLLCLPLSLFSCSGDNPTVMKVGDIQVSYNLLRYFVKNYRGAHTAAEYEADETIAQELSDNVYSAIRRLAACQMLADENELELSDEESDQVEESMESMKESVGVDAIAEQFGDERTLRRILELDALQDKLYRYLTDEYTGIFHSDTPTVQADIDAGNFFAAEYLFIYCDDSDRSEKRTFAQTLHERIAAGASMSDIQHEYETTFGLKMNYCALPYFTYTEEEAYFEEAVLALSVGELGAVIQRDNGFLIVRRTPLDTEYINEHFMSVVDSYLAREYNRYTEHYAQGLSIEWKSKYEGMKLWEVE